MIYLDNAATTAVLPAVAQIVDKYMCQIYGNPSSLHQFGTAAEKALTTSKKIIAKALNCRSEAVVFTSGGSESNNAVLLNRNYLTAPKPLHFITSQVEHAAVLNCFKYLETIGHSVSYLPFDPVTGVRPGAVVAAVRPNTALVSIMLVNNELGTINRLSDISKALRAAGYHGLIHSDACQAVAKIAVDVTALGVDLLSASAHKFHGPKGVGLLIDNTQNRLAPFVLGGGQQAGRRSGTENVAGIAGMAQALSLALEKGAAQRDDARRFKRSLAELADRFGTARCRLLGDVEDSSPYITALALRGLKSEVVLHAMEAAGVIVSSGSACHSNSQKTISHVIKAIALDDAFSEGVIRISSSAFTNWNDCQVALQIIEKTVAKLFAENS